MTTPDVFLPIPAWPGYSVSRLGQVRGKAGVLSCDAKGRVRLRNGQRQTSLYVGALMEQAGLLAPPHGAPAAPPELPPERENELLALRAERDALEQQVDGLRAELTAASETIARGRRLNGHLLALVRKQEENAATPGKHRAKSPRGAFMAPPNEALTFDDLAFDNFAH